MKSKPQSPRTVSDKSATHSKAARIEAFPFQASCEYGAAYTEAVRNYSAYHQASSGDKSTFKKYDLSVKRLK